MMVVDILVSQPINETQLIHWVSQFMSPLHMYSPSVNHLQRMLQMITPETYSSFNPDVKHVLDYECILAPSYHFRCLL
jgi:hypothetical protein